MTRAMVLMTLLFTMLTAGPLSAQASRERGAVDLGDNAALAYWQAIAIMPELTEAEHQAVSDYSAEPNPVRADVVKRIEPVIRLLKQGAAKEHAHWGIDMSPGPHTLLPHLQQVRQLSRLGLAAATQKMHEGKPQEAAEIAVAVMRMARHVAPAGTLIEMLVQFAAEQSAEQWIARHAPDMTPQARKYILAELDRLPPAATTASAMQGEKLFLDWTRKQFKAGRVGAIHDLAVGEGVEAQVKGLKGADQQTLIAMLDEAEGWYDQTVAAVQKPYPQVADAVAKVIREVQASDNALAKVFFPSVERVWVVDHASRARLAMLRAGLEKLEGAKQMPRDPYGEGAFKVIEHPQGARGFTLQSQLERDDKPIDLVFGTAPEKVMLGRPAPDFELAGLDGERVRLSSLRGKVVVLEFWATWCGPCVQALPVVMSVTDEFRDPDRQVVFYAVNRKEEPAAVRRFLAERQLTPRVLLDAEGAVAGLYGVEMIPQTIVIDRGGVMQGMHIGHREELGSELRRQLQSLTASAAGE